MGAKRDAARNDSLPSKAVYYMHFALHFVSQRIYIMMKRLNMINVGKCMIASSANNEHC